MEIRHMPEQSRFCAMGADEVQMGQLQYTLEEDGTIVATHTIVPPEFGGQGIAGKLTDALADYARKQKVKIRPVCSYIVRRFEQKPELYGDVVR